MQKIEYVCYVKGKTVRESNDSGPIPVYSFIVYLIIRPKENKFGKSESFVFLNEKGKLENTSGFASTTLLAYRAMLIALKTFEKLNMFDDFLSIYIDDPKAGKQVCIQPAGKKQQKITRRADYDFVDEALEVLKQQEKFKNLRCFWIPKESNNAELLLSRTKDIL